MQPLAGLHHAGVHEFLVVFPHVTQDLFIGHLTGFRFPARLHDHHNPHVSLLSFLYMLVERRSSKSTFSRSASATAQSVTISLEKWPGNQTPSNGFERWRDRCRDPRKARLTGARPSRSTVRCSPASPPIKKQNPERWRFSSISGNAMSCLLPTPTRTT